MGQSPWSDPLSLWCEKVGISDPNDFESEPMYWGNKLEPVIAESYQEKTQRLIKANGTAIHIHPQNRWQIATPDYLQFDDERGQWGILEIKAVNAYASGDWSDSRLP